MRDILLIMEVLLMELFKRHQVVKLRNYGLDQMEMQIITALIIGVEFKHLKTIFQYLHLLMVI